MKTLICLLALMITYSFIAQKDSSFLQRKVIDTNRVVMNIDAVYNRPFLDLGKLPVSVGGYLEANSSYFVTDGITDGLSFQLPRLTLFLASNIQKRIKFLTEIEFEEGGREINIEFASLDIQLHPFLNLRGGIILNPIGAFNQNHDGPKWEFISRPIASTTIIPSTWSNVGFGVFGKYGVDQWVFAYEAYLSNGFDDQIISNTENRTWLPATKQNTERFEESFNGVPLATTKIAVRNRKLGEIGVSWMGGVYNLFEVDGLVLDQKRRVDLVAIDLATTIKKSGTSIRGEWVWNFVDVPDTYSQQFGNQQRGGFIDVVQTILRRTILGWEKSVLNLAVRIDYADYNFGRFNETNGKIGDEILSITPGISFRPSPQTVIRMNYSYALQTDILGNEPARTGGFQVGFSTYF